MRRSKAGSRMAILICSAATCARCPLGDQRQAAAGSAPRTMTGLADIGDRPIGTSQPPRMHPLFANGASGTSAPPAQASAGPMHPIFADQRSIRTASAHNNPRENAMLKLRHRDECVRSASRSLQ